MTETAVGLGVTGPISAIALLDYGCSTEIRSVVNHDDLSGRSRQAKTEAAGRLVRIEANGEDRRRDPD